MTKNVISGRDWCVYAKPPLFFLLCFILSGCVTPKYVEHKQYLLDIKTPLQCKITKTIDHSRYSIFIEKVTATPPFNQLDFLYRVDTNQYITDYYNSFLVSPSEQLLSLAMNYLESANSVKLVVSALPSFTNKLHIHIQEFYIDYRNRIPKTIVGLHFVLTTFDNNNKQVVIFDDYACESVRVKNNNAGSLLAGWNKGINNIFRVEFKKIYEVLRSADI